MQVFQKTLVVHFPCAQRSALTGRTLQPKNIFFEQIFDKYIDKHLFEMYNESIEEQMFVSRVKRSVKTMYTAEMMERTEFRRERRARAIRQQKASRRLFFMLCVTLLLIFIMGVGFGTLLTRAEEPAKDTSAKYYSNIEIASGDTLWTIADTYMDKAHYSSRMDYINEVMTINHLMSDRLVAGQKLIVPYYAEP